jgi:type II secretory pathway component GspD/PulD (secretin)
MVAIRTLPTNDTDRANAVRSLVEGMSMTRPSCCRLVAALALALLLANHPTAALGTPGAPFTFDNVDLKVVVAEVARRTQTTFLYDPAHVKGTITVVGPADVTPAHALELLRSALALHGYAIVARPESMWIVRADDIARADFIVRVVPLTYADAGDVATTLAWIAPRGVRIAPHFPTNSVVIAGDSAAVEQMIDAIHRSK